MSLTVPASTAAMAVSLAVHVGAVVVAGMHRAPVPTHIETSAAEIAIDAAPPPAVPVPSSEPVPNVPPPPGPAAASAVHHEALAVHAVAATAPKPEPTPPDDAPHALVGDDALPHFTIATSTSPGATGNLGATSGLARTFEGAPDDDAPYAEWSVDVPARAIRPVTPRYPLAAQSAGVEGTVKLEIVLSDRGVVQSVRALTHPGHGFEQEAIAAARVTPFTPAQRRGRAVPVRMAWSVEFRLR